MSKITGKEGLKFIGKARCFDDELTFTSVVEGGEFKKGEKVVVVLRYLGPRGGPGTRASLSASNHGTLRLSVPN